MDPNGKAGPRAQHTGAGEEGAGGEEEVEMVVEEEEEGRQFHSGFGMAGKKEVLQVSEWKDGRV